MIDEKTTNTTNSRSRSNKKAALYVNNKQW
jgi:hypothetical protein